jgi:4-amino-4-deoxy-L-arabinose transferase-like glycosyltransferase
VNQDLQPSGWWLRVVGTPGRWFNIAVLIALAVAVVLVYRWRNEQFPGYGLKATYYERADFRGAVFRTGVERSIDFSDEHDAHFKRPRFSVVWSGTIVLPRSGRYVFATESDDGSWLEIDGRTLVDNGGTHEKRRVEGVHILSAGPHAIQVRYFQAGMGASVRVFWMPAGRRGGLEYIPATVLLPGPPSEVDARKARTIPPRDLTAVVVIGSALLIAILLLARRPLHVGLRQLREHRTARLDLVLFLLLLGGGLVVRLWDLSRAGQTWDEDVYWSAGRNYVSSLLSGNLRASYFAWNNEHPALAKWLYGPASLIAEDLGPARAVAALIGALTCAFVFLAGRDMIGRRVGFLGGALCIVMPHLVAHGKVAGLEAPSGLFFTLGIWLFLRGLRHGGNTGYHLAAGLCAGLAVTTRLTNISVLLAMTVLYVGVHRREILGERRFPLPITLGLLPLLVALTFFGLWPYLWSNPLQHLGEMLIYWKPDAFQEYFLGKLRDPPLYYFPLYYVVTMPVGALFGLGLGVVRILARRDLGHLCLLVWLLSPFIVIFSPMNRDGVRYLYPALVVGCLIVAAGFDWLAAGIAGLVRRPTALVPSLAVLGTGLGLYIFYSGLSVHPYYLDYYNEAVGGPRRVAKRHWFEIAWWGEGLKEAASFVDRVARRGARVKIDANPRHVITLRPDLVWTEDNMADYIIYNELFNGPAQAPKHRIAYVVRAAGAPLVWVYEREEP